MRLTKTPLIVGAAMIFGFNSATAGVTASDLNIGETEKNIGRDISRCAAHFRFDGNLDDATGNGHDALMVGLDRLPTGAPAKFAEGKLGQALSLTGDSVAVAPLDLHFEACPKITITAWAHFLSEPAGQMEIVSTGYGSGPRIALSKSNASVRGGANEIRTRSRDWVPPVGEWFPVVATWDYEAGTHTFYPGGDGAGITEQLGNYSREPQPDLWVGTYAYGSSLLSVASGILIDDLRVYDRILDSGEIATALEGQLPVGADCDCETSVPGQIPLSGALPNQGAGFGQSEIPRQVGNHDFSDNTPEIDPDNVPISTTDVLSHGETADGVEGATTLVAGRELSPGAADALQQARDENAPPDITYDSEEEGEAAAAAAASRREQELADNESSSTTTTETPPSYLVESDRIGYDGDVLRMSGVSGDRGDYSERLVLTSRQQLLHWIETREKNDKPCKVYVHGGIARAWQGKADLVGSEVQEVDVCDGGLPRINPLAGVLQKKPDAGEFSPITAIQVCNNGMNKRVKGIRARTRGVSFPDAMQDSSYRTVVMQERTNCSNWEQWVSCPANTFAIGATLFFRDGSGGLSSRDFLSGIELVCSGVGWRPVSALPKPGQ